MENYFLKNPIKVIIIDLLESEIGIHLFLLVMFRDMLNLQL